MIQTGFCLPEWSNMFYVVCLFLSTCNCRKREASAIELVFLHGILIFDLTTRESSEGLAPISFLLCDHFYSDCPWFVGT